MNNYTMNTYEVKRDLVTFSKKISKGLNKSTSKFVMDMEYGLSKSKSVLLSNIARSLEETIDLDNTIERLSDNLLLLKDSEKETIKKNYLREIEEEFAEEAIAIFDDSDISKRYGRKFEDLDRVVDASSPNNEVVNGYHVCEAVILTNKEKQPISVYSEIYSCRSKEFINTKANMDGVSLNEKINPPAMRGRIE